MRLMNGSPPVLQSPSAGICPCPKEAVPLLCMSSGTMMQHTVHKYPMFTQRLQCSSFLVMTHLWLRDYNVLPKGELHSSLWVGSLVPASMVFGHRNLKYWVPGPSGVHTLPPPRMRFPHEERPSRPQTA